MPTWSVDACMQHWGGERWVEDDTLPNMPWYTRLNWILFQIQMLALTETHFKTRLKIIDQYVWVSINTLLDGGTVGPYCRITGNTS